MVSTKCTISRADFTRVWRNSACDFTANQRLRKNSGTSAASSTRPETQSKENSAIAVNAMYSAPCTSWLMPPFSSSRIESRSLVWREMIRPDVYVSWNSRLSFCVCRNMRLRRSRRISCAMRADITWYFATSTAPVTATRTYAPITSASSVGSPVPSSDGSARSRPMPMRAGPATFAAVATRIVAAVRISVRLTGWMVLTSSLVERRRICLLSTREKSSLSSPVTPVTLMLRPPRPRCSLPRPGSR